MDFSFEPLAQNWRRWFSAREASPTNMYDHLAPLYFVADFLGRHGIDPNPANYELIYRRQILEEPGLDPLVEQLLQNPHSNRWSIGGDSGAMSGDELRAITDAVQEQLATVEQTIGSYAADTGGYGTALVAKQAEVAGGASHELVIDRLLQLTKAMIEKAQTAERELKDRNEAVRTLKTSLAEAKMKADTDMLTGLSNRRAFERALGAACARAADSQSQVSLAICDVDHFKSVNDRFGHLTGDRVLKLISDILQSHCGAHALVCRFGGEEFVILFEGFGVDEAYDLIEAAKVDLGNRNIVKRETNEPVGRVTFSAGIAGFRQAGSPEALLHQADLALYEAKANGRDCIFGATFSR